jgi:hypothetical protein
MSRSQRMDARIPPRLSRFKSDFDVGASSNSPEQLHELDAVVEVERRPAAAVPSRPFLGSSARGHGRLLPTRVARVTSLIRFSLKVLTQLTEPASECPAPWVLSVLSAFWAT